MAILDKDALSQLQEFCIAPIEKFRTLGWHLDDGGSHATLIPAPFGWETAPVLAVAHLDFVGSSPAPYSIESGGDVVVSRALDDRLGVFALLDTIPKLLGNSQPYNILLTENEETGKSSAREFGMAIENNRYNWIFSMDRAGTDCAHYTFTDKPWLSQLQKAGWELSNGTYSCIAELDHWSTCAINFGVAYNSQHNDSCWADLETYSNQARRVTKFYMDNHMRKFAHKSEQQKSNGGR